MTPDQLAHKKAREAAWRERNAARVREVRDAYYIANKERMNAESTRRYYEIYKPLVAARTLQDPRRLFVRGAKNHPCSDCKQSFPVSVMQFDHLRDKNFELSRWSRHTLKELEEELTKCEVVCANCHALRTERRRTADAVILTLDRAPKPRRN